MAVREQGKVWQSDVSGNASVSMSWNTVRPFVFYSCSHRFYASANICQCSVDSKKYHPITDRNDCSGLQSHLSSKELDSDNNETAFMLFINTKMTKVAKIVQMLIFIRHNSDHCLASITLLLLIVGLELLDWLTFLHWFL